jgi:2-hydroxychromene-2-carboxylate isomerase
MWRDLERVCADLGVPFRRPEPFPQNGLLAARVALVGFEQGWGDDFCRAVFRAKFAAGRRIDDPAVIGELLEGLKVDPQPALTAAQSDAIKARLRAQTEEAERLGIFGAPSFTCADGELFWGNDRLEQALRWATKL